LGIDDLEHGPVFTDTEFVADKKQDVCPAGGGRSSWAKQDVNGAQVQELIRNLVTHHVAVTSTLPVFEAHAPGRPTLQPRTLDAMSAESAQSYLTDRARVALDSPMMALLRKEMDFEIAFVKAGACCWPVLIQLETVACCRVSATSGKWSYSWKRVSLPSKLFTLPRRMAPYISASKIELEPSRRANRQIWF
jgi:hypothetical protein